MNKTQFNELWAILPLGDKERAYEIYNAVIEQEIITFDGEKVNHQYLIKKLKKYVEWWEHNYGKRDNKYVGKEDRKKTLQSWLTTSEWDQEYLIEINSKRDKYIFGNTSIKDLNEKLNKFEIEVYGQQKTTPPF